MREEKSEKRKAKRTRKKRRSSAENRRFFLVRAAGLEPTVSWSQRGSNLVLHVHENHLTLSAPENLLSGALFSAVSTSSRGGCGQTCGRMENAPVECGRFAAPRERLDCNSLPLESQVSCGYSTIKFCVAVDKEIRRAQPACFSAVFISE